GRPDLRGGSRAAGRGGRDGQVSLSPRPGGAARGARRAAKRTRHNGTSPRSLGNIMMSSLPGQAGPPAGADGHAGEDLLAGYAAGTVDGVAVWSVEAHLTRCARCRAAPVGACGRGAAGGQPVGAAGARRAARGWVGAAPAVPLRCPRPSAAPDRGHPVVAQVLAAVGGWRAGRGGRRSRGGHAWVARHRWAHGPARISGPGGPGAVLAGGPAAGAGGGGGGVPAGVLPPLPAGGGPPRLPPPPS